MKLGVGSVVQHFPNVLYVLSLISGTMKTKQKKNKEWMYNREHSSMLLYKQLDSSVTIYVWAHLYVYTNIHRQTTLMYI